ncbi:MAG: hypothetical protein ACXWHB_11910 [Usitatibacter sp.]
MLALNAIRIAAIAAFAAAIVPAHAAPTIGSCPVFPANNYWNTPVDTLPLHPSSATWVSSIGASAKLHPDWGNVLADNYGIPFATVNGSQPKVPITFPADGYADESDPGPFPIPPNAPIEGGSASDGDRHVIVVDTSACMLYELYYAFPIGGGASWSVFSSAKFDLRSNALRPATWTSADAAGLPIFPGLVRWDEVAAGEIAHAIRFTASAIWGREAGAPKFLWPARHNSGSSTDSSRPPMGARFRLKASFDISHFDARTQVILRAFKKYGLVLADGGSNWYFQGVSDTAWPDTVLDELKSIAGSNFEAVDTSVMQVDPNIAEAKQAGGAARVNVQGLWWRSPAQSESGWGVNLTQQGSTLFATWFTYDTDGSGMWLVMSNGAKTGDNTYTGTLYRTTGPAFSARPWDPRQVAANAVGTATFSFSDANNGTFAYTVNGVTQSKPIVREVFATPVPTCVAAETFAASSNFSDLWWNAPADSESGWGINVTHQGDTLFATWFTYDASGKGLWLVMPNGAKSAARTYSGALYRTTGPAFSATPWNPSQVVATPVGNATFTFSDSSSGTFAYTVDGVSQSKAIMREVFATPPTTCN